MSRKIKVLELSSDEKAKLILGYRDSSNFPFSRRCHIILLKHTGRTSKDIASILGMTDQSVNNWVKRFSSTGIDGLLTKPGQGRRAILDKETDAHKVREVVEWERQRLKLAKEGLEEELGKKFSTKTLSRFLKLLAAPTDGLG